MNDIMNDSNNKKKESFIGTIKSSFSGRKFRSGMYVTILSLIVIVIVLVANMIVSKLDLKVDVSSQNFYTLSKDTKNLVKDLKDDVVIYYMAVPGKEDQQVQKIAEKYDSLSNHIKLVEKDPILYPKFASSYVNDKISQNSFIVVNKKNNRAKYVAYKDMMIQELDQNTYQYNTTGIDVEGKLTSAIQYVTTSKLPVMYAVQGHEEAEVGNTFTDAISKLNVKFKTLETVTAKSIPKDCDVLLINAPQKDLSDDELTIIKKYMAAGGNTIITADYKLKELKNFENLINYYGLDIVDGIIMEDNNRMHLPNYPLYLLPTLLENDITKNAIDNKVYFVMPVTSGVKAFDNNRSSLKLTPLAKTSDKAYSKVNIKSKTISKEVGDVEGPFNTGMLSTDTYKDTTTKMVLFGSENTFNDQLLKSSGNYNILSSAVSYLSGNTSSLSIPTKSLEAKKVQMTQQSIIFWGALVVIIIPIIILVLGFVVCYLRRRK